MQKRALKGWFTAGYLLVSNLMWPGWCSWEMNHHILHEHVPPSYTPLFSCWQFSAKIYAFIAVLFFFLQQGNSPSTHPSQAWMGLYQFKSGPGIRFLNKEMEQLRLECPFFPDGVSEGTIGLLERRLLSLSAVLERELAAKNKPGAFLTRRQSKFLYSSGKSSGNHPPDSPASGWPCATSFPSPAMAWHCLLTIPQRPPSHPHHNLGTLAALLGSGTQILPMAAAFLSS